MIFSMHCRWILAGQFWLPLVCNLKIASCEEANLYIFSFFSFETYQYNFSLKGLPPKIFPPFPFKRCLGARNSNKVLLCKGLCKAHCERIILLFTLLLSRHRIFCPGKASSYERETRQYEKAKCKNWSLFERKPPCKRSNTKLWCNVLQKWVKALKLLLVCTVKWRWRRAPPPAILKTSVHIRCTNLLIL